MRADESNASPIHQKPQKTPARAIGIAIIVNAMHSFTEEESKVTMDAVGEARDHIEADLHQEVAALRREIAELKEILQNVIRNDSSSAVAARDSGS